MKPKSFFSGLSLLLLLNLLIKPAWILLIDRQVQNTVGHEAYGTYFALFNLTYVLLFAADAGLTNMLTQKVAAGLALNIRKLFTVKLGLLIAYITLCVLVGAAAGVEQWTILAYMVLIQSLSSLALFLRGLLTAQQLFTTDAVFSVLDKTLLLVLCAGPVYGVYGSINILRFVQLQLLATILSVLLLLYVCLKKRLFISAAQKEAIGALAKQTAPFLFIFLLMAAHYRLDGFLLERLHNNGAEQAGIYAAAYRLLDAGNMIGYLCASFLVPFVARHRHEKILVEKTVLLTRHGLLTIGIIASSFTAVFAPWLQQLFYHSTEATLNQAMVLCLAVLPAYYLVHVYGSVLTAVGKLGLFITVLLFTVAANLALNLLLIPAYGAVGCCIAALITQWSCGLVLWLLASAKFGLSYAFRAAGYCLFGAVACFTLFSVGKNYGNAVWIILALVCPAAGLLLARQIAFVKQAVSARNS